MAKQPRSPKQRSIATGNDSNTFLSAYRSYQKAKSLRMYLFTLTKGIQLINLFISSTDHKKNGACT